MFKYYKKLFTLLLQNNALNTPSTSTEDLSWKDRKVLDNSLDLGNKDRVSELEKRFNDTKEESNEKTRIKIKSVLRSLTKPMVKNWLTINTEEEADFYNKVYSLAFWSRFQSTPFTIWVYITNRDWKLVLDENRDKAPSIKLIKREKTVSKPVIIPQASSIKQWEASSPTQVENRDSIIRSIISDYRNFKKQKTSKPFSDLDKAMRPILNKYHIATPEEISKAKEQLNIAKELLAKFKEELTKPYPKTQPTRKPEEKTQEKQTIESTVSTSLMPEDAMVKWIDTSINYSNKNTEKYNIYLEWGEWLMKNTTNQVIPGIPSFLDKTEIVSVNYLDEINKSPEWIKLLEITKKLWISNAKIANVPPSYKPVIELNTTGSNLLLQVEWSKILITWQEWGKIFATQLKEKEIDDFIKTYNSGSLNKVLTDAGFMKTMWVIWALTIAITLWFPILALWWASYVSKNLDSYVWLDTNDTIRLANFLKESYPKNYKDIIKAYIILKEKWIVTDYKTTENEITFTTVDWIEKTPTELISISKEKSLPKKYEFLSSLNKKWLNVELKSNWTYELDFVWSNNNSLSFHWNNVILTVDNINKTFLLDIWTPKNLKKALDTIDNVDKLLEVKKEITRIKHNTTWVRIWLGESEKEEKRLEKDLGIN